MNERRRLTFFEEDEQRRRRSLAYSLRERVVQCLTVLGRVTVPESAAKYRECLLGTTSPKDLSDSQISTLWLALADEFGVDPDRAKLTAAATLDELVAAVRT